MLHKNQYDFTADKTARNTFYHLYLRTKWTAWKPQHYKQIGITQLPQHSSSGGENPTNDPSILYIYTFLCTYWGKMSWSICYVPRTYWGSTHTLSLNLKYLQAWTYLRFTGDNTEAWEGHMTCSHVQLIQVIAGPRTPREGSKDRWVLGGATPPRLSTIYLAAARGRKGKPQEGPIIEQTWLLRGKQGWCLTGHPQLPVSSHRRS